MGPARWVAIVLALIGGCTLTTPLDGLGSASTTQASTGVGGAAGAAGGSVTQATLSATAMNHHRIELVWTGGLGPVDIERDGTIIRTAVTGTSFQDRGLEPRESYTYRIRVGGEWSSAESATTTAEPVGSYVEHVISDEPRGYWQMDAVSNDALTDTMENIEPGILNGGALQGAGKFGMAVKFDGVDDHADLRTVHTEDSDWGWSWELWVYVVAVHTDGSGLLGCANSPRWTIDVSGTITAGMARRRDVAYLSWSSESPIEFGSWHHLVLTVEGAITNAPMLKLYTDGQLVGSLVFAEPLHSPWSRGDTARTADGDLRLDVRDSFYGVEGTYDEAAAYDYVLSPAQIARHYNVASNMP